MEIKLYKADNLAQDLRCCFEMQFPEGSIAHGKPEIQITQKNGHQRRPIWLVFTIEVMELKQRKKTQWTKFLTIHK